MNLEHCGRKEIRIADMLAKNSHYGLYRSIVTRIFPSHLIIVKLFSIS